MLSFVLIRYTPFRFTCPHQTLPPVHRQPHGTHRIRTTCFQPFGSDPVTICIELSLLWVEHSAGCSARCCGHSQDGVWNSFEERRHYSPTNTRRLTHYPATSITAAQPPTNAISQPSTRLPQQSKYCRQVISWSQIPYSSSSSEDPDQYPTPGLLTAMTTPRIQPPIHDTYTCGGFMELSREFCGDSVGHSKRSLGRGYKHSWTALPASLLCHQSQSAYGRGSMPGVDVLTHSCSTQPPHYQTGL